MLHTFLIVLHLIVCFLMVGVILLQSGKGAEIGAAFGGASQTIFGSRGPGTFLSKVTVAAAIIFMSTSLGLAMLSKEKSLFSVTNAQEEVPSSPASSPVSGEATESPSPSQEVPPDTDSGKSSTDPKE